MERPFINFLSVHMDYKLKLDQHIKKSFKPMIKSFKPMIVSFLLKTHNCSPNENF